jgi:membrane protein involved in colicin uptake
LSLESQVLGLELHLEKGTLRFYDTKRRIYLRDYAEEVAAHKKTQSRARTTALERTRAKKQLERAEKQLEIEARARAEAEAQREIEARARAEAEAQREIEARARAEAEARLREMEAELQRLRGEAA